MGKIFGGSKSSGKSTSSNKAYEDINSSFSPMFGAASSATNDMQRLLGGDSSGFDAYKKATGFDAFAEQGSRGILGAGAAKGLLRSGASGKALQSFGQTVQNQFAGDYMQRLLGVGGMGMQAGQLVTQAGQQSESTQKSKQKNGIGKFLGAAAGAAAASDERLKKDIIPVGTNKDGLTVYQYRYKGGDDSLQYGVMAQEVAVKKPEALGPVVDGYMSVDYSKIGEVVSG